MVLVATNVKNVMETTRKALPKPHNLLDTTTKNLRSPAISQTRSNCSQICNLKKAQSSALGRISGDRISYESRIPSKMLKVNFAFTTEDEDDNSLWKVSYVTLLSIVKFMFIWFFLVLLKGWG